MSLKHILLGELQQPKSGYDIKKKFDQVFSNFWSAELSQIYPQLKKLTEAKMLKVSDAGSSIGPSKKVYQTTELGITEVQKWLIEGPQQNPEKISYLAQTYFLNTLHSHQQKLDFMIKLSKVIEEKYNFLNSAYQMRKQQEVNYPESLDDEAFYNNLTLLMGVKKLKAIYEWSLSCIKMIEKRV